MTGCVFSVEEFSVYDGPGIRTSVFLKGCPLSCSWCHNPEGQQSETEIVRSPNGCTECGKCEEYAQKNGEKLCYTEKSIENCPRGLLRYCGEEYTAQQLCEKLVKNKCILDDGGGVTFSGGEPLFQSEFLCRCLDLLDGKLHRAVQTSGFASEEIFEKVLEKADFFLFDLKLADSEKHKKYTGVPNEVILKNFEKLCKSNKAFTVRIPLIPSVTDTAENIRGLCDIMKKNGVTYAELLPYNKMAGGKYKMTGRKYTPDFDENVPVEIREDIFKSFGIEIYVL